MTDAMISSLARIASETAMRAAADYFRLNKIEVNDFDRAVQCLRAEVKLALPLALDEAKEAFDANMSHVAEATFRASLAEAGIRAAKQFAEAA